MAVAEPPEPIAALGDAQLFPGTVELVGRSGLVRRGGQQMLPRFVQPVPCLVAFGVSDPDAEIVLNPTAGE